MQVLAENKYNTKQKKKVYKENTTSIALLI